MVVKTFYTHCSYIKVLILKNSKMQTDGILDIFNTVQNQLVNHIGKPHFLPRLPKKLFFPVHYIVTHFMVENHDHSSNN